MRRVSWLLTFAVACSEPDHIVPQDQWLGPPPDATVPGDAHSLADNLACESELAAEWATHPPTTGIGPAAARASYEQVLLSMMADYDVPGGAVAVTRNGKLVLALGLGFADRDALQPVNPDALFRLASVSKQITAVGIMKLVDDGLLSLDDQPFIILSDLQPAPGTAKNAKLDQITVRDLLQHRGGWNRDVEGDPMFASTWIAQSLGVAAPASCREVTRYMLDQSLTYDPGTVTCYSNFGYCVLGEVIARRSGMSYEDYVRANVTVPAGSPRMQVGHTLLAGAADGEVHYYDYPGAPLATSVFPADTQPVPWPYGGFYLEAMAGNGAWIASPVDMLRFQVRLDGQAAPPDLLDGGDLAAMLADPLVPSCTSSGGTTPADPAYWYGFGLAVNKYGNYWHNGSLPGTTTEDVITSNGFAWSAFLNTRPESADLGGALDVDLWTAFDGVAAWPGDDYFDQYRVWSAWMGPDEYAAEVDRQQAVGNYPVRVEGRPDGYRAQWAPQHAGEQVATAVGMDCLAFRTAQTGLPLASLQSFTDEQGLQRYQATWAATP